MSRVVVIANVWRFGAPLEDSRFWPDVYPFGSFDWSTTGGRERVDIIPAIHARVTEWQALITASVSQSLGTSVLTGTISGETAPLYAEIRNQDGSLATSDMDERNLGLTAVIVVALSPSGGTSPLGDSHSEPSGTDGTWTATMSLAPSNLLGPALHSRAGSLWWPNIAFSLLLETPGNSVSLTTNRGSAVDVSGSYAAAGTLTIRIPSRFSGATQDFACTLWALASGYDTQATTCDVVLTPTDCFSYDGIWAGTGEAILNPLTLATL